MIGLFILDVSHIFLQNAISWQKPQVKYNGHEIGTRTKLGNTLVCELALICEVNERLQFLKLSLAVKVINSPQISHFKKFL